MIAFTILAVGFAVPPSAAAHPAGGTSAPPTTLRPGASGPEVTALQTRLAAAGYWLGRADGYYGTLTQQAVLAFQKVHGLARDGIYGPVTRKALEAGPARPSPRSRSGLVVEIDKRRLRTISRICRRVEQVFNTSTGSGLAYMSHGRAMLATTPSGRFTIHRQIDGVRVAELGRLYRPKYFNGGIAIHGAPSIPAYPASHGCARVTNAAMDWMWTGNRIPLGTPVEVY